jgi:membrane associated rhomboid family serine protease
LSDDPPLPDPTGRPAGRVPIFNAPPGTIWTAAILVVMFLTIRFGPHQFAREAFDLLAFAPQSLSAYLATDQGGLLGALIPLVGHSLLHIDWLHLVLNAGFLLAFGTVVERCFGTPWFLAIFAITAAAGALFQFAVEPASPIPMIGASGAVYGMMGGAVPALLSGRGHRRWRMGNALTFIGVMMVINLAIGLINADGRLLGAAIAWQAHIGGFLAGLAICGVLLKLRKPRPG